MDPPSNDPWRPKAPAGSHTYWLEKAEEARAMRDTMHDRISREMMLDIIRSYEFLAELAAKGS